MKLLILYFSATGITGRIAKVIGDTFTQMGGDVTMADITSYADRQRIIDLKPYHAVVFGAPIHSWRAPKAVKEWIRTLNGQGKKCSTFFTYGGFGVHPTHYSTGQLLGNQNFIVVSSAEFLGFYSFNRPGRQAREDRLDESYFEVAIEYARKTFKRFTGEDKSILEKTHYTEEQLDTLESFKFNVLTQIPTRDGEDCSMCLVCEESCPTEAMNAQYGEADKEKCIACLACVNNCPENVLKIKDVSDGWSFKGEMEKIIGKNMKGQKSKIYL
ncbi:MAG: 4Fe-4S ferredoxin [Chloroflexi bacterium HGW-Chloroflexi-5]|jgi:ferredoxin/flavodoxin|nr:MAG: 4Fe-4S ferredoxin [Deltaproteobacteria bacterium HGW-Deltaproteobacteria-13]PKN96869.1 MAG: 4Fe-4S ferredoxin [Chloroflexi bacterium HGW-Chloroflexi-5]